MSSVSATKQVNPARVEATFNQLQHEKKALARLYFQSRVLFLLHVFLQYFSMFPQVASAYERKKRQLLSLQKHIEETQITLVVSESVLASWKKVVAAYVVIRQTERIWEILGSYAIENRIERTPASVDRKRREVVFKDEKISWIHSNEKPITLPSTRAKILIYPSLAIVQEGDHFSAHAITSLSVHYEELEYIENDSIPQEAKILKHTWEKANLDGSMDKRFTANTQIPIVTYGLLRITIDKERKYLVSNTAYAKEFVNVFTSYRGTLQGE